MNCANARLQKILDTLVNIAKTNFEKTDEKQKIIFRFYYSANSWNR
jgi:hypothetical protein